MHLSLLPRHGISYSRGVSGYPNAGTVLLGKYRVESLIGAGGMGYVLKAHHLELDQPVAIKCLLPELLNREDQVQRFSREARACSKLRGPHVARVMDVGRLPDNSPIIVMEYLEGADLGAIIKAHGAQDPAMAVDMLLQACEGLAEAHGAGIIHRDVKSSNFFIVQPPNQPPLLKVLDFGIATAPAGTSDLTGDTTVMGTPDYMAPEQMRSTKDVDQRSDIWSLGVVLYELLDGTRPFRSETYASLCFAVGMDPPEAMTQPVPAGLQQIVLRCLAKPLAERYQTVAELAWDLVPFASDPALARGAAERCARYLNNNPGIATSSSVIDLAGSREAGAISRTPASHRSFKSLPPPMQAALPSNAPTVNYTAPSQPGAAPTAPQPTTSTAGPLSRGEAHRVAQAHAAPTQPHVARRRPGRFITGVALAAGLAIALVVWKTQTKPSPAAAPTSTSASADSSSSAGVGSSGARSTAPNTAPKPAPTTATTVLAPAQLHVTTRPPGATVWRGDVKLGATPLHVEVPATVGDLAEPLRLELADHHPLIHNVILRGATNIELTLVPEPTTAVKPSTDKNKHLGGKNSAAGRQGSATAPPLDIIMNR